LYADKIAIKQKEIATIKDMKVKNGALAPKNNGYTVNIKMNINIMYKHILYEIFLLYLLHPNAIPAKTHPHKIKDIPHRRKAKPMPMADRGKLYNSKILFTLPPIIQLRTPKNKNTPINISVCRLLIVLISYVILSK
jgi:hypothetical protein